MGQMLFSQLFKVKRLNFFVKIPYSNKHQANNLQKTNTILFFYFVFFSSVIYLFGLHWLTVRPYFLCFLLMVILVLFIYISIFFIDYFIDINGIWNTLSSIPISTWLDGWLTPIRFELYTSFKRMKITNNSANINQFWSPTYWKRLF